MVDAKETLTISKQNRIVKPDASIVSAFSKQVSGLIEALEMSLHLIFDNRI